MLRLHRLEAERVEAKARVEALRGELGTFALDRDVESGGPTNPRRTAFEKVMLFPRLLLWIMGRLEGGEFVDVITLLRKLLASDIDATSAETGEAYRALCDAGVLERADYLPSPGNPDCFRVRVALLGDNESKYPGDSRQTRSGRGERTVAPNLARRVADPGTTQHSPLENGCD